MYRIVCPTDFSEVSKNALLFAISLVNDIGGHLEVAHFYEVPHATGHDKMMDDMVREGAEKELQALLSVSAQWLGSGRTMEPVIARGDCTDQLRILSNTSPMDLIVMGSSNSTQKMKLIFGSTTKAVINRIEVPTLVVPGDLRYRPFRKVVLAVEDLIRENALNFISSLGKNIIEHLYLLHVGDINVEREMIDHYNKGLTDYSYSLHNTEGDDVLNGINSFVKEVDADLLVMIKRKRNFLQRIFGVSHTDLELFQADVALLILHESE